MSPGFGSGRPRIWVGTSRDQKTLCKKNFGLILRPLNDAIHAAALGYKPQGQLVAHISFLGCLLRGGIPLPTGRSLKAGM